MLDDELAHVVKLGPAAGIGFLVGLEILHRLDTEIIEEPIEALRDGDRACLALGVHADRVAMEHG
ncbi:hypothetical protein [Bifidobacterium longum]|uniref:hypothetical protein n=1 Tax=Bifidobacterium longum TaxID=216816 RepID=UPI001A955ED0|nr:hypothetical protein [Bifidobacterium longum]